MLMSPPSPHKKGAEAPKHHPTWATFRSGGRFGQDLSGRLQRLFEILTNEFSVRSQNSCANGGQDREDCSPGAARAKGQVEPSPFPIPLQHNNPFPFIITASEETLSSSTRLRLPSLSSPEPALDGPAARVRFFKDS
jgi:hypothetical protein